jgi:predicted phage-related endonuclease
MCTALELNNNVKELQELRRMREELDAEIEGIEDILKQHMKDTGKYEIDALTGKVTWLESTSSRFDSASFKKELPDLYSRYSKPVTTRYFRLQK